MGYTADVVVPNLELTCRGVHPKHVVHVLALDGDPFIRQMIVDFLGDYDFRVTAVGTGAEMADVLRREPVDLLVLDLRAAYPD